MTKAVVLFSGGMDSLACLYWAMERYEDILILSFLYGSKEDQAISKVSNKIASLLSIENKIIELPFLKEFSQKAKSSLVENNIELPKITSFEQLDQVELTSQTAKEVWIPGRNILFLSIAASFADSTKVPTDIIFGANQEEGTTFPDNTLEFVNRMNESIEMGCLNQIKIQAPFHDKDKREIVIFLERNQACISYSSSCYQIEAWTNDEQPIHCGICESCQRRKRAFQFANINDPTVYR